MRDRAWCIAHDRSLEFETSYPKRRVCFQGLGNEGIVAPCRTKEELVVEQRFAGEKPELSRVVEERDEALARLAQIAELLEEVDQHGQMHAMIGRYKARVLKALRLARGEAPG